MACKEIRETISAYVDGEASPEEAREVREHLRGCAQCRSAEKRMRALEVGVSRTEGDVPPEFRDRLFARMEKEDLLPKRRSIFAFSVRWAAVPLAAAAALALYIMSSREIPREFSSPEVRPPQVARELTGRENAPSLPGGPSSASRDAAGGKEEMRPQVAGAAGTLSPEDREIVANLEILEDPELFDEPQIDEMEIFVPPPRQRG
ncbi:MAG TPA: zf-HC2 domain-containing protein [Candidatus Deferrimicrobiaceae bacterium]|nr:zf-HC2 domain-containing protein [Candidatus Deferrimicrobiaceae bacterium]